MSIGTPQYDVLPGFTPVSSLGLHRLDDFLRLDEGELAELIYGRLVVSPARTTLHQTVSILLAEFLLSVARQHGGRAFASPVDVVLADHSVVQPDLVYVVRGRRGIIGDRINGAPDLAIEILSPQYMRRDRSQKLSLYAEFGVKEYWIVDPREQQFDFLVNRNGRFEVQPQLDDRYASPVLPELQLDLAAFWGEVKRQLNDDLPEDAPPGKA